MIPLDDVLTSLDAETAALVHDWHAARSEAVVIAAPPASEWPFMHPLRAVVSLPPTSVIVWMRELHEAFVNEQTPGTRLVTTQPAYLMQAWIDAIGQRDDVLFVATGDAGSLTTHAPEVLARRGPFARADVRVSATAAPSPSTPRHDTSARGMLARAFRSRTASERLRLCIDALDVGRTPAALVATASTCMEVNDLDAAVRDLDDAIEQAPDWAAAHFERGKLWLRVDDMERASESFRAAAQRMPQFGSAWANLGATLGELDRPDEALAAFQQALAADPESHQALNNIGVVSRELGQLAESETAFRRVIALVPDLAFGHYNLGHTLFLQGRYQAALSAYVEGQKRDPERNAVQATRLAVCRLATGDSAGALLDLQRATGPLPRDYKQQLLSDTHMIAWALLTHRPDLPGWTAVNEWLTAELARL